MRSLDRLFVVETRWNRRHPLARSLAQLHAAPFISGRPVYVQRNGLANTRLKYAMKFNSFARKSSTDVNEPRRITFRMITPKITSIWFSHELGLGRYTNRIRRPDSDKNACRLATDFSTPRTPFLPRSSGPPHSPATSFPKLSGPWMFKLSRTTTHDPPGSQANVCSMWLTTSSSVRVGPIVGRSNSPVVTTKLPIRHNVPCRVYSDSISSHFLAIIGLLGAFRSSAWMPVISSTQTVWVPLVRSRSGASR